MTASGRFLSPFFRHPWPYPSACCLLSNIARLHVLDRKEIAALWLSGPPATQCANQLDGMRRWVTDERIAVSLRLSASEVRWAFDSTLWWPKELRGFAIPFADPLRFCPACLEQGYHSNLFQLPWWQRCPIHDVDLLSGCTDCGGSLIGLGLRAAPRQAFLCSCCGRDFVNTGALVDSARGTIVAKWHSVVATHRSWAAAVSKAYVVAPKLVTSYCEIGAQSVIKWIQASGVSWPKEIRGFVSELSTRLGGLWVRLPAPKEQDVETLGRLSASITHLITSDVDDFLVFPAVSPPHGRTLARRERKLQRANSGDNVPLVRLGRYGGGQDPGLHALSAPMPLGNLEALRMRDRGFRLRRMELRLTEKSELTVMGGGRNHLIGLSALRLLCHVKAALAESESTNIRWVARDALEWWYAHLTALALIDGTAAAIHFVAFPDSGAMQVPGWPPVDLGRHPPGHAWVLAATRDTGGLVARLVSVPLAPTVRPDTERAGELQRVLGAEVLTFQNFASSPGADRNG